MVEMELKENQLVRVVGGGGGVGWAVVVDECGGDKERGKVQVKHTLVPESYLEAVKLDWMDWEEEEEELRLQRMRIRLVTLSKNKKSG